MEFILFFWASRETNSEDSIHRQESSFPFDATECSVSEAAATEDQRRTVEEGAMRAIVITTPGGPEVLQLKEVADPKPEAGEVVIKIAAGSVNRADTYQREGGHPPPAGASPYPGLECSGVVEALGDGVTKWKVGDEVCALLSGGGYAEKVAVPEGQLLPIPKGVSLRDAAGLPEVVCTVWSTVFMMSKLVSGETFLVHGGSSGIGTFAIQIAKAKGCKVFTTVGSATKAKFVKELGADLVINYKEEDFVAKAKEATGGKGVDVILDNLGASYFQRNLDTLGIGGRLFMIGFQGGAVGEFNLAPFLRKRLTVQAAGLRVRTKENKAEIVAEVRKYVWPAIESGQVKPIIDSTFPLAEASQSHSMLESSAHIGKILLIP